MPLTRHHLGSPHQAETDPEPEPAVDPLAGVLDTFDPDDREPMGGDPWWAEDPR